MMIKITGVSIKTDFLLIEDVTVSFNEGNIYGLSAANGTGKSTFLRTLADLRVEEKGCLEMFRDNKKIVTSSERKKSLFFFETTSWLDPHLSGTDYLCLITSQWKSEKKLISEAINFWDMAEYIDKPIRKYSLGMKQKLLLSMYYVSDATFWFLDEPTLALDQTSIKKLKVFIIEAKNRNKCIVFSAHENDSFFEVCTIVYSIENRKLVRKRRKN